MNRLIPRAAQFIILFQKLKYERVPKCIDVEKWDVVDYRPAKIFNIQEKKGFPGVIIMN